MAVAPADADPPTMPALQPQCFSFDGEPAVTVTSVTQHSDDCLDVTVQLSAGVDRGRILTISIPDYAVVTVPVTG